MTSQHEPAASRAMTSMSSPSNVAVPDDRDRPITSESVEDDEMLSQAGRAAVQVRAVTRPPVGREVGHTEVVEERCTVRQRRAGRLVAQVVDREPRSARRDRADRHVTRAATRSLHRGRQSAVRAVHSEWKWLPSGSRRARRWRSVRGLAGRVRLDRCRCHRSDGGSLAARAITWCRARRRESGHGRSMPRP